MSDRFTICHEITARWEGGWSNHPDDPGGATMYGVTQAKFTEMLKKWGQPSRSVRTITHTEALRIYREEYWLKCGAHTLFSGVDLAVYDASVNSGVSRGRKWLVASVGSSNHAETVKKICRARLSFMQSLAIWKSFGKGWGRRVADIEARGVVMAMAAMGASAAAIKVNADKETSAAIASAAASDKVTKASGAVAGGSAAGAGGDVSLGTATLTTGELWTLAAIAVALGVVAFIAHKRKQADRDRAAAYREVLA